MSKLIEIFCENTGITKEYPLGICLKEIIKDQKVTLENPILGAMVNNELEELDYEIFRPKQIRFIDITSPDGLRVYIRSLSFVLYKAVKDLFPDILLKIEHSISNGFYCELDGYEEELNVDTVMKIVDRMREIVAMDIPFRRVEIKREEAIGLFEKHNLPEKAKLFSTRSTLYTSLYSLSDDIDYFYGYLLPSTGYLKTFDLVKYYDGMLLMIPKQSKPDELEEISKQDQMFEILREYKKWVKILEIATIGSINEQIMNNRAGELIKISEALHEKKVSQIADMIFKRREKTKIVLISGPSSSGKTTFSKRLAIQLRVAGLKPMQISLDSYFVEREKTPLDENGEYDYEALEALDVELFNSDLLALLEGKEVKLPTFSFEDGKRYYNDKTLQISNEHILIIEGIHGLNPKLTPLISPECKFKIYVSALTQVGIDWHNRIPTTDNRLIRRIIRDYRYRNYSALETLHRWESVRCGEEKHIFPFQEEADIMFNSALVFELGVLKWFAEPLLKEVYRNQPEYAEALRLLKLLSYFKPVSPKEIPPTSILREFVGKSSFDYSE